MDLAEREIRSQFAAAGHGRAVVKQNFDIHREAARIYHLESPRVYRRLHFLRGWSYEQVYEIFAGSPRAGCPAGV